MRNFYIDTNVLLQFLLNDIPSQANLAQEYLTKAKSNKIKIIICQITIFELYFALDKYYKFSKSKTIELLESIFATPYLDIEDREAFIEALNLYKKNNVDFVDLFLFCKANNEKGEVLSLGKDFQKLKLN